MKPLPYLDMSLPLETRINDLLSRLTPEEKIGFLPTKQTGVPRLGIRDFNVGGEGAHGVVDREGGGIATGFPQTQGLSCTWDAPLLGEIGSAVGDEARMFYERTGRTGWLMLWFPTIDMERDPRWGRTEEAYGEDPYLAGKLAASLIRGAQGDHPFYVKISTAPKHFYANNVEEGREYKSSVMDKRNKREYYLKVFSYAFREGKALSLMTAYNKINGTPGMLNPEVRDIVKGEWGCDGFVVCDGFDFELTVSRKRYCRNYAEVVALAMRAGVDCFTDREGKVFQGAREALALRLITEEDIDRALFNIFKVRFRLGEFDDDSRNPYAHALAELPEKHAALALRAAREAVVLLKNDGFLPLGAGVKTAAVIGELADTVMPDWYTGNPPHTVTPLAGIQKTLGDVAFETARDTCAFRDKETGAYLRIGENGQVFFDGGDANKSVFYESEWGFGSYSYQDTVSGKHLRERYDHTLWAEADKVWGWFTLELFKRPDGSDEQKVEDGKRVLIRERLSDGLAAAEAAAKKAAAANGPVFLVLGNHTLINGRECFDRPDIAFPARWTRLAERVTAANPNTVLVITASYPFAIPREAGMARAVLYTAHGGQDIGAALSDVIFGKYAPAGRLSMTWYLSAAGLPDIDDYDIIRGKRTYLYFDQPVLYPFGHGLSYTRFEYSGLTVAPGTLVKGGAETAEVSFTVQNAGDTASDEVAQLYFAAPDASVKRPRKQLAGFERVHLRPGESKRVTFALPLEELAYFDIYADAMRVESGRYALMAGASSEDIRLTGTLAVQADAPPYRDMARVDAQNYDRAEAEDGSVTLCEDADRHVCVGIAGRCALTYERCAFEGGGPGTLHIRFGGGSEGAVEAFVDSVSLGAAPVAAGKAVKFFFKAPQGAGTVRLLASGTLYIRDFFVEGRS